MEDYKGMFAELADLAMEEQAMFTISVITKSDEAFDKFMDARERGSPSGSSSTPPSSTRR